MECGIRGSYVKLLIKEKDQGSMLQLIPSTRLPANQDECEEEAASVLDVDDPFDKTNFKGFVDEKEDSAVTVSNFSACYRIAVIALLMTFPAIFVSNPSSSVKLQRTSSLETTADPIIYFTGRLISRTLHLPKIYVFSRIELYYLLYDSADERNGFPPSRYHHPHPRPMYSQRSPFWQRPLCR